jgi:NTP pyrophosphatase (non-canonical NTP hydrolase)
MIRLTDQELYALRSVQLKMYQISHDAGWHNKPREDGTMIALCHSELSEALEGFRKNLMDEHLPHRKMAEVELADCIIRIFDLAQKQGFDLAEAIDEKSTYNQIRPDHQLKNREKDGGKSF